ncbi:aminotransferase class I/II-fold pyridoxal phosphate-dependent enzyme [Sporolactobacillus sp. STSJ-5]|uniref:aminotransferase class I/II-fold pyridoxal phosphate-dependent enzyme n=1 Tax=Sporolactobacillus sp. STSJ-5 TaxID=2965076 RepID=UPI00210288B0|nr:aminotransferase class I/II-fold pyridoxal phosphate-dependent enzyme [Sporolactobacillus sp. STSJ-5]MCQ2009583.1 aminotransferase class I/II-fold pyridoxal phosphate-dependent enzyme [Sporolactobacillus sp. STSJ-5]
MTEFAASERLQALKPKFFAQQAKKIKALKEKGLDVINLGRGNPDQPTFPEIVSILHQASKETANQGYPPYGGKQKLKQAIADFYKKNYQVDLDPDTEIAIFNGSIVALTAISLALLNPGDTALVPDPAFGGYEIGVTMAGAHAASLPLLEENDFLPDYTHVPQDVSEKAKLLFLNYPNNPTGASANAAFFEKTVDYAKQNNLAVVHDFAYGDIGFEEEAPRSFLQTPGAKDAGIEIYTFSKTFNMAGWRVAFAAGNASLIKHLNHYLVNNVGGVFGAVQDAAAFALGTQERQRAQLRALYQSRRDYLIEELTALGYQVYPAKGTFFLWVRVPQGFSATQYSENLLDNLGIAVVPGTAYGSSGESYFRVSLVVPQSRLRAAVERIKQNQLKIRGDITR